MERINQTVTATYLKAKNFVEGEEGQGLVEYALIIALVAIALIVGLGTLASGISATFSNIAGSLD